MDMKERLERISKLQKSIDKITSVSKNKSEKPNEEIQEKIIEEILSGNYQDSFWSKVLFGKIFSLNDYMCGDTLLSQIFKSSTHKLSHLVGDKRISEIDIRKLFF